MGGFFPWNFLQAMLPGKAKGKGKGKGLGLSDVETRGNEAILKQSLVRSIVRGMRDLEQRLECHKWNDIFSSFFGIEQTEQK